MKLLKLLTLSVLITFFSCSTSNDDDKIVNEEPDTDQQDANDDNNDGDGNNNGGEGDGNSNDEDKTTAGIKYGPGFIVFEPEITKSDLGLWVKRIPGDSEYHVGDGIEAINKGYLEFTGNNLNSGQPKSPLEYTFKCSKSGKYRLVMRMYQPLKSGEAEDKRNDAWIKLTGDYTTACVYPTEELKKNHKLWGRGIRKWGSMLNLEGHVNGVKRLAKVVYNLKKDENYTLTISGRAQGCSIDYILFFDESLGLNLVRHDDLAAKLPEQYRPDVMQ